MVISCPLLGRNIAVTVFVEDGEGGGDGCGGGAVFGAAFEPCACVDLQELRGKV